MDKLKPCPFCGHEKASLFPPTCTEQSVYSAHDRAFPIVRCYQCHGEKAGDNWDHSGASAVNQWNTRTTDAALAAAEARIAELEKALEPFARDTDYRITDDTPVTLRMVNHLTVGDLRHAAALLKEKE